MAASVHHFMLFVFQLAHCLCVENIAINKQATQSNNLYPDKWLAGAAVDGHGDQRVEGNSCACTSDGMHNIAWWTVDLGRVYAISEVKIFNRDEDDSTSLTYRLSGFYLYVTVGSSWLPATPAYTHNEGIQKEPWPPSNLSIPLQTYGRYVTIYKDRTPTCEAEKQSTNTRNEYCSRLELCEVEVFGCLPMMYGNGCNLSCQNNCRYDVCSTREGTCFECKDGYKNSNCSEVCGPGTFGNGCSGVCSGNCKGDQICNFKNGICNNGCADGYKGSKCNEVCDEGTYGAQCLETCGLCANEEICDPINGKCSNGCIAGKTGDICKLDCDLGYYGDDCQFICSGNCFDDKTCNSTSGLCDAGCKPGWIEPMCDKICDAGTFGMNCSMKCSDNCLIESICNHENGHCTSGCNAGWTGNLCNDACPAGQYGRNCNEECGQCVDGSTCDQYIGLCLDGCAEGYLGDMCTQTCRYGFYGANCSHRCNTCETGCHFRDGKCLSFDNKEDITQSTNYTPTVIVSSVAFVVILLFSLVLLIWIVRSHRNKQRENITSRDSTINDPQHDNFEQIEVEIMNGDDEGSYWNDEAQEEDTTVKEPVQSRDTQLNSQHNDGLNGDGYISMNREGESSRVSMGGDYVNVKYKRDGGLNSYSYVEDGFDNYTHM